MAKPVVARFALAGTYALSSTGSCRSCRRRPTTFGMSFPMPALGPNHPRLAAILSFMVITWPLAASGLRIGLVRCPISLIWS
jgi:hypothetical protein